MTYGRIPDELKPGGEFDEFVADLAAKDEFSGTVLLTYHGHPVIERSYRMADKKRRIPNGPNTIFNLASVTKVFTGIAIAQLVQQGKLTYGGKLGSYLDGFSDEIADTVTVHQLLTHTSGLGRPASGGPDIPGSDEWDGLDEIFAGTMAYIRKLPLNFTPGTKYEYSNDAYFTLGAIVAEVSGKSYYDYVREHVFAPAGMTSTDFYVEAQWHDDVRIAHPYAEDDTGKKVDVIDDISTSVIGHPAAGSFARASELARFATALQNNQLLEPAFTELVASPKMSMTLDNSFFLGYAMAVQLFNGQWVIGHNGGSPGVSVNLDWFPDSGWVVVVLTNYDRAAEPVVSLARDIITGQRG